MSIPADIYKFLEIRCDIKSEEYKLLKSGLIDGDRVMVRCDMERGEKFASWADACFPGAGQRITLEFDPAG